MTSYNTLQEPDAPEALKRERSPAQCICCSSGRRRTTCKNRLKPVSAR